MEQIRQHNIKYGLICDEFGSLQGIITMKDILEALVGTLPSDYYDLALCLTECTVGSDNIFCCGNLINRTCKSFHFIDRLVNHIGDVYKRQKLHFHCPGQ